MESSTLPQSGINPPPTSDEFKNAEKLVEKAKAKAKLNRPQSSQQAWDNIKDAIAEIKNEVSKNG